MDDEAQRQVRAADRRAETLVLCKHGLDTDPVDLVVIAGHDLGDVGEAALAQLGPHAAGRDDRDALAQHLERAVIEMIPMRV